MRRKKSSKSRKRRKHTCRRRGMWKATSKVANEWGKMIHKPDPHNIIPSKVRQLPCVYVAIHALLHLLSNSSPQFESKGFYMELMKRVCSDSPYVCFLFSFSSSITQVSSDFTIIYFFDHFSLPSIFLSSIFYL